jgi:hypothetical protein
LQRDITTENDTAEDRVQRVRIAASEGTLLGCARGSRRTLAQQRSPADRDARHWTGRPRHHWRPSRPRSRAASGHRGLAGRTEPTFAVLLAGDPICPRLS